MIRPKNMLTGDPNYIKFTHDLQVLIERLRQRGWKVGFAESCTGGRLSAVWTEISGVSDVFSGSIVSYSNDVKIQLLGVQEEALHKEGAVSLTVAGQMARGLKKCLGVDWALAITGIAGPKGGNAEKPVGTVCFGIVGPQIEDSQKQKFSGDRVAIQQAAVEFATRWLAEKVK